MHGGTKVWWVNQFAVQPSVSGGTRHYDMTAELRRRGIDTRIVASDLGLHSRRYSVRKGPWDVKPYEQELEGVPFHFLPAGSYQRNDWRRSVSMLVFGVASLLFLVTRRGRKAVVIGSSPHLFAALGAWAGARLRRWPFVFEVRDLWPESYEAVSGTSGGALYRVLRAIADLLYLRADHIVVLAEGSRAAIEDRGIAAEKITWIPNGVDVAAFPPRVDRPVTAPVRFVYTGAHGPANGLDIAIRAAAETKARGREDIEVALVGDGPVKPGLQALAHDLDAPVRFLDPVPKNEIASILEKSNVGLMVLADVELFQYGVSPNKLFDYLAAGLPVLTNVPGFVTDVVTEAGSGLPVAAGDPSALADGMEQMADRLLAGSTWPSGRAYIERRFDRRALAGELESLLRSLTS